MMYFIPRRGAHMRSKQLSFGNSSVEWSRNKAILFRGGLQFKVCSSLACQSVSKRKVYLLSLITDLPCVNCKRNKAKIKGKRGRGRPRKVWMGDIKEAAGRRGKTIQEARSMAMTRKDFRRWTEDPTLRGKRER
jgi:hypothetical protein